MSSTNDSNTTTTTTTTTITTNINNNNNNNNNNNLSLFAYLSRSNETFSNGSAGIPSDDSPQSNLSMTTFANRRLFSPNERTFPQSNLLPTGLPDVPVSSFVVDDDGGDAEYEDDNAESCPICLEPLTTAEWGVLVPCGHCLHRHCFSKWCRHIRRAQFRDTKRCPSCSRDTTHFQKVYITLPQSKPPSEKKTKQVEQSSKVSSVSLEDYGALYMRVHELSDSLQSSETVLKEALERNEGLECLNAQLKDRLSESNDLLEQEQRRTRVLTKTIQDCQVTHREVREKHKAMKKSLQKYRTERQELINRLESLELQSKMTDSVATMTTLRTATTEETKETIETKLTEESKSTKESAGKRPKLKKRRSKRKKSKPEQKKSTSEPKTSKLEQETSTSERKENKSKRKSRKVSVHFDLEDQSSPFLSTDTRKRSLW